MTDSLQNTDVMGKTYSVYLWDHEMEPEGGWCDELAAEHLERPATGLTIHDLRRALRRLYAHGWSFYTILVERESTPARLCCDACGDNKT